MNRTENTEAAAGPAGRPLLAKEIRPGVTFPDWSVVTSPRVRDALCDIFEAFGGEACWNGYGAEEDRVRRAIFEAFAETGHAPTLAGLAERTGRPPETVAGLLGDLRKRDLVVLDERGESVTGAYPLTERATEHTVRLGGHDVHAMCAIDALGVGRMYGRDVTIASSCRATGRPIRIETGGAGTELASVEPEGAVVWSGIRASEGCAADTLCTVMAFFDSDEALETWRAAEHPDSPGYRLSIEEAMQAGMAIFGPMLAPGDG